MTNSVQTQRIHKALDKFVIELPSWGFSNTGTRFGKFIQGSAATTTEEKLADAGQVHHFTGCCPSVATHVLWDFPEGLKSTAEVMASAAKAGVRRGRSTPTFSRTRFTRTGHLATPTRKFARPRLTTFWRVSKSASRQTAGTFRCGLRMVRATRVRPRFATANSGLPIA